MSIPIPLGKLELSPMNVRQTDDGSGTADLEASILAHGMLSPLVVHTIAARSKAKVRYGVLAGGRRLRALQAMAERGEITADHAVECVIRDHDDEMSTEISVIENTARVALSPVQEFTAFAHLAESGIDTATVAKRFGITELHVKQRMRLGQLHPDILGALDAGKLTLDAAKAYAATADQALQLKVFGDEVAMPYGSHQAHRIRHAIQRAASAYDTAAMMKLVGVDAYLGAGGQMEEDLFTGASRVLQPGTLSDLYYARLDAEKAKLAETLPDHVSITTDGSALPYRLRVDLTPTLSAEQQDRRREIDERCDEITALLDDLGEPDPDHVGDDVRVIASDPARQEDVDTLLAEMRGLEAESDKIDDAAEVPPLPDAPLVAHAVIEGGALQIRGYYRVEEPEGEESTSAGAAPVRQTAEQQAKAEHGLTLDAIEVMRVQRRSILRAMMVSRETATTTRTAGDFLTFTLLRSVLSTGYGYAAKLGVTGFSTSGSQVPQPEVQAQRAAEIWSDALAWAAAESWMTEVDLQVAFANFTEMHREDRDFALAIAAGLVLEKPLNLPGYTVPVHDQVAFLLGEEGDDRVRYLWTPTAEFFDRFPKKWRLEAVKQVNPVIAGKIGKLPNGEISAACARFFAADAEAQREFGMMPGTAAHARRWVPEYLRFDQAPAGRRLMEEALDRDAAQTDAGQRKAAA